MLSFNWEHPETGDSYHNIGVVMHTKGNLDGALAMFNKCLAIEEKTLGSDHPDTAVTCKWIAMIEQKMKSQAS